MSSIPKTHSAVVTTAPRAPLAILQVPTPTPTADAVLVHNLWTASTPLDLHQADGGLLVKHPQILGDGNAGVVVAVGPDVKRLRVGDRVFGFTWQSAQEKAHQEYVCAPEYLLGKVPEGVDMREAVGLGNNFVTVFHALSADLSVPLPYPKPPTYLPPSSDAPILIWGGSSSVGQYTLQVLRHWGYTNLLATASPKHHALLRTHGATSLFDYRDPDVAENILATVAASSKPLTRILDCIGSLQHSLAPLTRVAGPGCTVAVLLPVVVAAATADGSPEYSMDVEGAPGMLDPPCAWAPGVRARGVRTHFYLENETWKEKLQGEIMPAGLREGWVVPNRVRVVEGGSLLERAERALGILRGGEGGVSGERLVWRVAEGEGA